MRSATPALRTVTAYALLLSCSQDRYEPMAPAVFDTDVAPILQRHCTICHDGPAPAAGWSSSSYLSANSCVQPSGAPAASPTDERAPILAALGTLLHRGLLSGVEQATLSSWVRAGAPAFRGTVHDPAISDPRSAAFHGALLRSQRWSPMLDANDAQACGRCHDGTPAPVAKVKSPAPGAAACTTCHTQKDGPLACATCHGADQRNYPPRDLCFFPGDAAKAGAHAAHAKPSPASATGIACSTCHPTPGPGVIAGLHGDGTIEVVFDKSVVSPEASYDAATRTCAVSCHDRGGARARPSWDDTRPMGCSDCHSSPPAGHVAGPCTRCHTEANESGTALSGGLLHMNGKVDLGDGSGKCGACHGIGDNPWPATAAHAAHENPRLTLTVECKSCHPVPNALLDPMHLDGVVNVIFAGRAVARGASPTWNGHACASAACHGASLIDPPAVVPAWADASGAASQCGACHGIPPTQHTPSTSCDRADCHGSEVTLDPDGRPRITPNGKSLHINGTIDHN